MSSAAGSMAVPLVEFRVGKEWGWRFPRTCQPDAVCNTVCARPRPTLQAPCHLKTFQAKATTQSAALEPVLTPTADQKAASKKILALTFQALRVAQECLRLPTRWPL